MNIQERIQQALEPLFLAMLMVWTVGVTVALVNPQTGHEQRGVVEIYSLTAVADANAGV